MNLQEKLILAVDRLGIDHETEKDLLLIAQDLVASELPRGWEEAETTDETGQALVYFYNHETDDSQWDHPRLNEFLAKVESARSKSAKDVGRPVKSKSSTAPLVEIIDLGGVEGPIPEGTCNILEPVLAVRNGVRTDKDPQPAAANSSAVTEEVKDNVLYVPSAINTPPGADSDASQKYSQDEFSSESSANEDEILALFDDPLPAVATPDKKDARNQQIIIDRLTSPVANESPPVSTLRGSTGSTGGTSAVGQRKASMEAYCNLAETADQLRSMQMTTTTTSSQGIRTDAIFQAKPAKSMVEISLRNELADTKRAKSKAEFDLKVSLLHHAEQIEDMKRELDAAQDDANDCTQQLHDKCAALEADKDAALRRIKVLETELEQEHQKNVIRRSFLCDASVQAEECQYSKLADEQTLVLTNDSSITTLEKENRMLLEKVQALQKENAELLKSPEKQDDGIAITRIAEARKQVKEMRKQCRAILQTIE